MTLTDQGTKIGTTLNGQDIKSPKGQKIPHVLQEEINIVTMGRYASKFRHANSVPDLDHLLTRSSIIWVPVNFTFSFANKESKADPWTRLYTLLGPLDVKVLREYVVGETTHLAARKRNTAKGLQALIEGKHIVDSDTYIDALVQAGTPSRGPSPLEMDFGGNFPDPLEYLPSKGDEPTQRDGAAYAPDLSRKEMFGGYTFIFYEKRQYDSLANPIFLGGGKALLKEAVPEETEVVDFVRYVKSIAGEKGLGEFEDGSEGKGVVVVRFNPAKGPGKEWYTTFGQEVSIHLDHRFIEQNEFLDAILGTDASVLRRPLKEADQSFAGPLPSFRGSSLWTSDEPKTKPYTGTENSSNLHSSSQSAASLNATAAQPASSMAPPVPVPRGRRRAAVSKFKGFDDDDDDDVSFAPSSMAAQDLMDTDPPPAPSIEPESQGLFVSQAQSQGMFVTQESQQPLVLSDHEHVDAVVERMNSPTPSPGRGRNSRKRAAPIESESFMDMIAPAAAQAKKRKIADDRRRRRTGTASPPPKLVLPPKAPEPVAEKPKKRVVIKPVDEDFMEKARSKRQILDDQAREEREALEQGLEDMDISEIRRKVQIGSMAIGRSTLPPQPASRADESERWDDNWNGRKNFKKFKRRGGENLPAHRKILLRVTEAVKRDFGIGDEYWLDDEKDRKKKKGKDSQSQSQPSRNRSRAASKLARASEDLSSDDDLLEAGIMKPADIKKSVAIAKIQANQAKQAKSQSTLMDTFSKSQSSSTAGTKRPASSALTKEAPAKKAKKTVLRVETEDEEDSDEDGLAFKYSKKKR